MNCLNYPIRIGKEVAVTVVVAAAFVLTGCNPSADTNSPDSNSNSRPSGNTVELSGDQLNAIKIAPVETYAFSLETEAVGRIDCEEDLAVVQAESTLLGAAAAEEAATNVLARARALYDTNGVSKAELEQDISTEETDRAALAAAHDAVLDLGITDAEMDQMIASGTMDRSPTAKSSTNVPTKWLVADVDQSDGPLVQVGQPVEFKVTGLPGRVFKCNVSRIYAVVDPNLHRVEVRCEIADPKNELRLGMLAGAMIRVLEPVESVAIPANGVVRDGDGTMTAWVTSDRQHFTQRIIKTGMRKDGEVQVLDGLRRGELVVTDGAVFIDNILFAPQTD
jgi:cobalt-zinc-cadmium efflux system membrane fusion protein